MNEQHEIEIASLMDDVLGRLRKDVKTVPPQEMPALVNCIQQLYQMKAGVQGSQERNMVEITLLKQIKRQINNFEGGESNGSNQITER